MTTEQKIKEQIEFYYKNSEKVVSIDTLLTIQDRISANYFFYSTEYNQHLLDYANSYGEYKSKFSKTYLESIAKKISEDMTSAKAQEIAKKESVLEWSKQMFDSAKIESMKCQMNAIQKVLHCISQKISHLKQERNITNSQ